MLKFLVLLIITAVNINAQTSGLKTIHKEELMQKVGYLASEKFEGRLSGSKGYNKAAEYAANYFKELGLKPANGDSYYQNFEVEYNQILPGYEFKLIQDGEVKKDYKLGEDFVFRGFTGSGDMTGEVAFCGYGISMPEIGYDDYADIDVQDKIVMVFKYNPSWKIDNNKWSSGAPRVKARVAAEHGAKGILFVSKPNDKNPQKTIGSVVHGPGKQDKDFPQLHIDLDAAKDFLNGNGYTLSELQTLIDSTNSPNSKNLGTSAKIKVKTEYSPNAKTKNVVALLEGSDPKLKDEYVILGAHLDHVGKQAGEIYFPGANDNASGSAAVMEIAEAFAEQDNKPKRSILFVLFAAEESGLEGASYFAENPLVPLENSVAMLNMDCVGYGDSIRIGGGKASPKLWNMIKDLDEKYTQSMVENTWYGGGADATPFFKKGIPTAYFVTTNSYAHLHYMTDTAATLNYPLYERITKLAYLTVNKIAQAEYDREELAER
jgi:hypothetical protein